MPKLKEAAVAVQGQIIDIERLTNFDTKKYDGQRVVIATGDGFVSAKLSIDEAEEVQPMLYNRLAWMVRYGAWAGSGDAQTTCRFVRAITDNDLDLIVSARDVPVASGK